MRHRTSMRSRAIIAAFAALLVLAAAGRAEAQTGTGGTFVTGTGGTSGSSFQSSDFFMGVQQFPPVNLTTFQLARFFNKANCDCSAPVNLFISLLPTGVAKRSTSGITTGTLSVVLGNGCSSILGLQTGQSSGSCLQVASESVLTFLNQGSFTIPTDSRTLSVYFNVIGTTLDGGATTGTGTAPACTSPIGQQFTQTVNFNFNFGSGGVDLSLPFSLTIDLVPPPAPTGVTIRGGDEALVMNWTAISTANVPDLLGYQILCSRADQYQVFNGKDNDAGGVNGSPFGAAFQTCPSTRTGTGVQGLDPAFICSGLLSAQSTSDRVEILQNDITYAAAVVAIDNSGNPSEPIIGFGTPVKTLSFYDVYRDQTPQGDATGGFCALSTAPLGAKATGAALGLFALGSVILVIRRRRKGRP
jgi:hypothetical protein